MNNTTIEYNYKQIVEHLEFLSKETTRLSDSGMLGHATLLLVHQATLVSHLRAAMLDRSN